MITRVFSGGMYLNHVIHKVFITIILLAVDFNFVDL